MPRAIWNGTVIAESDQTVQVDGNHYFPPASIKQEFFEETATETTCGWKGTANYYSIKVDGQENADAAWAYRDPLPEAAHIKDHLAFWKGVVVEG